MKTYRPPSSQLWRRSVKGGPLCRLPGMGGGREFSLVVLPGNVMADTRRSLERLPWVHLGLPPRLSDLG